jgi:DNA-binding response OmpR family regulator
VGDGIRRDRLRVLVVDDDDSTRKMLTQFFNDEGFETLTAENGAHALAVASADEPDVIVLDMGLPVLDASGFALQWKQRENAFEIPVVAISGQPFGEAMAREIGAVIFYDKPLDLTRLAETVRDLATRQAQRRREVS